MLAKGRVRLVENMTDKEQEGTLPTITAEAHQQDHAAIGLNITRTDETPFDCAWRASAID
jgi:hypothetical protein